MQMRGNALHQSLNLLLIMVFNFALCSASSHAEPNKWLLFRGTPDGAGSSDAVIQLPLMLKWKFQPDIAARQHNIPPVTDGENVYYACGRTIYAINCEFGHMAWAYDAPQTIPCSLALVNDLVVAVTGGGHIIALKAKSGTLEWTFRAEAGIGVPPIAFKEHIFVVTHTGTIHLLNAINGEEVGAGKLPTSVASMPAMSGDWLAMITSGRRMLITGLNQTEKGFKIEVLANSPLGVGSPPTQPIAKGSFVYVGVGHSLCYYDVRWRKIVRQVPLSGISIGAPALRNNVIYIATRDGTVHAINIQDNKEVWQKKLGQRIYSGLSASAEHVWVTAGSGILYALDIDDGKVLWRFRLGDENPHDQTTPRIYSPPTVTGDGVYVTSSDGSLYAFTSNFIDAFPPMLVSASLRAPSRDPNYFVLYKLDESKADGESKPIQVPGYPPIKLLVNLADAGSGTDPAGFQATCTRLPQLPFEFDEAKGTLSLNIHVPTGKAARRALPDGEYLVVVTARDYAGNVGRYRLRFRINNALPLPAPPEEKPAIGVPTTPGGYAPPGEG
ncbi:MAG: PQQ-binding-like beta-propeller repeat protein [Armatimonadota bacterium]|nr:PQQ-binding-like beta-propeller repeat protein [Armatimonadota bacterium]MCX7777833.1 PQQ-binding-like beta-propeller repeat protein [Armatimonadota bacterium]MDW8025824.1 PQQ-binding-like beta-propeller repeat protein [Armatimonadota bacterium]